MSQSDPIPQVDAAFVQDFSKVQRPIYLAILAQVGSPWDAEDILQNVNLVIWKKAAQFQPGTSFYAWAQQIAHFEVLQYRRTRHRDRLRFSDEFFEQIAKSPAEDIQAIDSRRRALASCIEKLRPADRELVEMRYAPENAGSMEQVEESGKVLSRKLDRPVNSIYQSLGRIRRTLLECIERQLTAELG